MPNPTRKKVTLFLPLDVAAKYDALAKAADLPLSTYLRIVALKAETPLEREGRKSPARYKPRK